MELKNEVGIKWARHSLTLYLSIVVVGEEVSTCMVLVRGSVSIHVVVRRTIG